MTSFSCHVLQPRSRRGLRSLTIAALTAGAVLLPAGSAFADHMPGMENGTMCPHAAGEGPDALPPVSPDEPVGTERAPSEAPLAAAVQPQPAAPPASKPAKTTPAAEAPKPATEVTRPATQVETRRPATTAQPVPVEAVVPVAVPVAATAPAPTAVARLPRPDKARAQRPARSERPAIRAVMRGIDARGPSAVLPSATAVDPAPQVARPAVLDERPSGVPVWMLVGLLLGGGLMAGLLVRRRGSGGAPAAQPGRRPIAPDYADAVIEAELHEMISEARARELLPADGTGESAGTR